MKNIILGILTAGLFLTACEKKIDPVDTYYVTVSYNGGNAKNLVGDITVNPKDSFYLDFKISSATDMSYVEVQRNGVRIDTFRLNGFADKRNFSLAKGYRADSAAGDYSYRVLARDAKAVFMGDGGKLLKVTVMPDFDFWSYRILQVPDTNGKTNPAYYSVTEGKTYSYTDGAAKSVMIDFGYYYDTTGTSTSVTTDDLKHTFYALNSPQPQLNFYDISTWTKNATVFKKMPLSVNFVSQLTSSGAINTLIRNNMTSGTSTKVNMLSASAGTNTAASNSVVGFRTASGKYGAILIRFINQDSPAKGTAMEIDVKVQK